MISLNNALFTSLTVLSDEAFLACAIRLIHQDLIFWVFNLTYLANTIVKTKVFVARICKKEKIESSQSENAVIIKPLPICHKKLSNHNLRTTKDKEGSAILPRPGTSIFEIAPVFHDLQ